jgi:hypothetical protein
MDDQVAGSGRGADAPRANVQNSPLSEGMLMAFLGQRRALVGELDELQARKSEITGKLQQPGANTNALRAESAEIDKRISDANTALRAVNRAIRGGGPATADEAPEAAEAPAPAPAPSGWSLMPPGGPVIAVGRSNDDSAMFMAGGALLLATLGLASLVVLIRRLRRQTVEAVGSLRSDLSDQIAKFANGVESMAVEIERIGEGQRYVTKLLSDAPQNSALPVRQKEAEPVRRP